MSQTYFEIIGIGSPIVDSLAHVEESFIRDIEGAKGGMELVNADQMQALINKLPTPPVEAPGGSAGNTLFALAKLGITTTFLGKLGNDASADFYKNAFKNMGGDTQRFKIANIPNGRCLSLITPDGQRTMRTDLGAAMTLSPNEISETDFKGCKHAHLEGYLLFNPDLMSKIVASAKKAGCTLSLDLASFEVVGACRDRLPSILQNDIDIVFANEDEAGTYCGKEKSYDAMAKELGELCEIAVVKLGKEGSLICKKGEIHHIKPVVVPKVLDTTAAGDFWAAGFLYGWLKGKSLSSAGHCGSLLGAEVVQVMGSVLKAETWNSLKNKVSTLN